MNHAMMDKFGRRSAALLGLAAATLLLAGCTTREAAYSDEPMPAVVTQPLPSRSYLDAGPVPSTGSGPNYLRDGLSGASPRTDTFGGGVFPRGQ